MIASAQLAPLGSDQQALPGMLIDQIQHANTATIVCAHSIEP
jgi:hypothetical protein